MKDKIIYAPSNNIVIGNKSESMHSNCIIIGDGLRSSGDYRLIVDSPGVKINRTMPESEFALIRACLLASLTVLQDLKRLNLAESTSEKRCTPAPISLCIKPNSIICSKQS